MPGLGTYGALAIDLALEDGRPWTAPPPVRARAEEDSAGDRIFRNLLLYARTVGASDLHLIAERAPLVRVGGKLVSHGDPLDPRLCEQMLLPRVPVRLAPVLPRDGSVDFALEESDLGRYRVNVSRQRTGLKASLRIIPAEIPTLASLGLPDATALVTHYQKGLILITGPAGSGKTTTLAAMVDLLNQTTARHIVTFEDPVEFVHPRKRAMMSQREVGTHTRSYQAALKASLREDSDVIVLGELRNIETVRLALAASETGHLVLATMNTPSLAKTIDRLVDLFPPGDEPQVRGILAGGLRLLVSQRLVPTPDERRMVAAVELLPGSVTLWNLIRDNKTSHIPVLQQRLKGFGAACLDDSLTELVRAGKTTLPSALSVAEFPAELEAAITGRQSVVPASFPPPPAGPTPSPGPTPHSTPAPGPPASGDRQSGSPQRLSEPFGQAVRAPSEPPAEPKGLIERAGLLFGKRGT
jgi:twitching motility protein PilT